MSVLPFERLLDLHMEQRHANVCVLPVRGEWETGSTERIVGNWSF